VELDGGVEAAVVVLADYWRPAWRAGGPVISLGRMVDRTDLSVRIVTRDHDLGSPEPLPGIRANTWVPGARVGEVIAYLSGVSGYRWAGTALSTSPPMLLHINSLHSIPFGILPMLAIRLGRIRPVRVLISPHGELSQASQEHKPWKKRIGRPLIKALVPRHAVWHASSLREVEDIERWWGNKPATLIISPDPAPAPAAEPTHGPSTPTVLFASRIHPIKGLDQAIEMVKGLNVPCRFVIAGSIEDQDYWTYCRSLISDLPDNIQVIEHGPYAPTEITDLVSNASVLLLPTKGENFGQVIAEALAHGCPVVIPPTTPWGEFVGSDAGSISGDVQATLDFLATALSETREERLLRRNAVHHAYTKWFTSQTAQDVYAQAMTIGARA